MAYTGRSIFMIINRIPDLTPNIAKLVGKSMP